jgi:VIT1/CCC1 family predicted Fe2+/Mn2+ transporter
MSANLSPAVRAQLLAYQRDEITEHHLYLRLASRLPAGDNRAVLERIAADELCHYETWHAYTGEVVGPDWMKVRFYALLARVLGFTFAVKLMEKDEQAAQGDMENLEAFLPEARTILQEEEEHEKALLGMLDEELLRYTGSMVLGLSDALVELTGTLAGLTLALQNTRLISLSGLITGVAASLSMGASEYLSTKAEKGDKSPVKASLYTGGIYLITVFLLLLPYFLLKNYFACLGVSLAGAVGIILLFTYYVSVAQDEPFGRRFAEMAGLSLGVAAVSFGLGYLARLFLGVDV